MLDKIKRFAGDRIKDLGNITDSVSNEVEYRSKQLSNAVDDHINYVNTGGVNTPTDQVREVTSWAGKPGQFADKSPIQNGLDALNKSGADPKGFADGNENDLALVKKFYSNPKNNNVLNQYDLSTNLYLRYMSGKGGDGLEVSPNQKQQISGFIKQQQENLKDPNTLDNIKSNFGQGHIDRIQQGDVPVYFGGWSDAPAPVKGKIPTDLKGAQDASTSLGSFWATPNNDGGFNIEEDYNFKYAPKSKGGSGYVPTVKQAKTHYGGNPLKFYSPRNVAGRQAIAGYGQPFSYTLSVPGQPNQVR